MQSRPNDDRPKSKLRPVHRQPADPTDGVNATEFLGDVGVLIHELRNLLDGSLRCLSLARRSLCASDAWARDPQSERVQRQLDATSTALEQMATLVHGAMQGPSLSLGSPLLTGGRPVSLADAIDHAVEVMSPAAAELGVSLSVSVTDTVGRLPAGPLYLAVLNGLKNSVESINRLMFDEAVPGGMISVTARTEDFDMRTATVRPMVAIEITDDGVGPPGGADLARVFEAGFTHKPGSLGLGLAVARSVVEAAGGNIVLLRRRDPRDPKRPGALLRIVLPVPTVN
jgi:signal transduction histidine kinase